jgi:sodium transport system permease protein
MLQPAFRVARELRLSSSVTTWQFDSASASLRCPTQKGKRMIPDAIRRSTGTVPSPRAAVVFVAGVAVLFAAGGSILRQGFGEVGLMASQWTLLLFPALFMVRHGGFDPIRTLSLRIPSGTAVFGAAALILGTVPLIWYLGWIQTFVLPVPWQVLEGLDALVTADSPARLLWLLLLLAVTPAVCEEAVFRGILLGSTRTLEPWRMLLLNGLVFGLFHLSLDTAVRFLPTATLGIVIAWAVWRSGSIWVGVLMHFLNNAVIVVLASISSVRESLSGPEEMPALWLLPAGIALVLVGRHALTKIPSPLLHLDSTPTEGT